MARAAAPAADAIRSILSSRLFWIWAGIWLATRGLIVSEVGFWDHAARLRLQDVGNYEVWSHYLTAKQAIPSGEAWQYPPGAAFLMLLPRLGPGSYGESFVGLMALFDLAGLGLLAGLGRRAGNYTGVWVWLLACRCSRMPVLRFDMVPTVIAIAALVVIHRRPTWFGALAGLGAAIKVWPAFVLFGEWDRRRLLTLDLRGAAAVAAVFLVACDRLRRSLGVPDRAERPRPAGRGGRHLAVAAAAGDRRNPEPRRPRSAPMGRSPPLPSRSPKLLEIAAFLVLLAAAWWWWLRDRAIRNGREDLADEVLARDFVFTIVLLFLVTSRVLSPQFMIWMVGLAGVVLTAGRTRLARPAWIVIGATMLSTGTFNLLRTRSYATSRCWPRRWTPRLRWCHC